MTMALNLQMRCDSLRPLSAGIRDVAGTSFKAQHAEAIAMSPGPVEWFEVHPENYMVEGGPRLAQLEALRRDFGLSLHGVGLSLGSGQGPNDEHLGRLRRLIDRFQPGLVSEHLAWSSYDGLYLADLLPPALTESLLEAVVNALDRTQTALGRQILIENPSWYLPRPNDWLAELEFLREMARRSGCGLLIDVNNIYVSAFNLKFNAAEYVDAIPGDLVGEIHLAGFSVDDNEGDPLLIDSHGAPVDDAVWSLYERLLCHIGPRPSLIEWDNDLPEWTVLRQEAMKANDKMGRIQALARRAS